MEEPTTFKGYSKVNNEPSDNDNLSMDTGVFFTIATPPEANLSTLVTSKLSQETPPENLLPPDLGSMFQFTLTYFPTNSSTFILIILQIYR